MEQRLSNGVMRAAAMTAVCCGVAGCGGAFSGAIVTSAPTAQTVAMAGKMMGGQQPVSGATITMYGVSLSGDGAASTSLMNSGVTVTTNAGGGFSLTGMYTCPTTPTYVYIVGSGGDPGVSANNAAIEMMSAVGLCSGLTSNTSIMINEITTVADVAALYPYMTSYKAIGSANSDAALLTTAMGIANEYVNSANGIVPGPALPSGYSVPSTALFTLADAIAACVNSTGGTAGQSNACGYLFTAATPSGGTAPKDTIAALIDILNNPTANPTGVFNVISGTTAFQPSLSQAPVSWALPITQAGVQTVQFNSSTYSVNESAGTVTLGVSLVNPTGAAVSVNYATADGADTKSTTPGNAVQAVTYTSASGTLNWAAGNTATQTITVPIIDVQDSSGGSILFTVGLSSPNGASLGVWSRTTVTILLNDTVGKDFTTAVTTQAVSENAGTVAIGVQRHGTVTGTVTLNYATSDGTAGLNYVDPTTSQPAVAGTDYTATSGTMTWTSSSPSVQYINVPITNEQLTNGTKLFQVFLSSPSSGWTLGESSYTVVTINENDSLPGTLAMATPMASVGESAGLAELFVTRTGGSTGAVTVTYATSNATAVAGTDYTATTGTLSWASGDATSKAIDVPVTDAGLTTGSKSFNVTLSSPGGGALLGASAMSTITINDNDTTPGSIQLSAGTYSVNESAGSISVPVTRTSGTGGALTVSYSTQNGTGTAGVDYATTSGTLTFAAGSAVTQTIVVPVMDEGLTTGTRTFNIVLNGVTGGALFGSPTSAIVTINDVDPTSAAGLLQFGAGSYATAENAGAASVTVTRTGGSTGAVSVTYATSDYSATGGTDYSVANGTLNWVNGDSSSRTISTSIYDQQLYSGTRTFNVVLSGATGGAALGTASVPVVISESDTPPAVSGSDPFASMVDNSYSNITDPVSKSAVTYYWNQLVAGDFGPDPQIYITPTTATQTIALSPLPSAGVHPRLLFTAADLPAIQCRLTGNNCNAGNSITVSGQLIMNKLLAYSAGLHGVYSGTAAYAYPDIWQGQYEGSHGNVPVWDYTDPVSLWYPGNNTYADLAAGKQPVDVATGQPEVTSTLWPIFTYEALRCLLQNDTAGMQTLAAAATFELTNEQAARSAAGVVTPYSFSVPWATGVTSGTAGFYFAYTYDFIYNYLTPAQQTQWTNELVNTSWYHDNYGTLNTAAATRSNWATFTYWTPGPLALYGETGYNDLKLQGIYRENRNFLNYGIFPSGTFVEAEAKDQIGAEGMLMLQRLYPSVNLFEHSHLQAYLHNFLPASVIANPAYQEALAAYSVGPFVRYDLLGGTEQLNTNDIIVLHYMYPKDATVDWLYQISMGANYQNLPMGAGLTTGGYYDALIMAVPFITDFSSANSNPANLNLPLTYFSGERALMMTRSDWGTNAMQLFMHTREFNGGHPYADRNSIFIFGKGRDWTQINRGSSSNLNQSLVTIDAELSKPIQQGTTTPGRMVDFQDQPLATFAVGDASYAWDWTDTTAGTGYTQAELNAGQFVMPTGNAFETHSKNSFAYTQLVSDEMNLPLSQLPSWVDAAGRITPVTRIANLPVIKAYRTAGMVRGATPYGLVLDDIQVSTTTPHYYDWQLLLEADLGIVSVTPLSTAEGVYDIMLAKGGVANPGDPVLLVRVLQADSSSSQAVVPPYLLAASGSATTRADQYQPMLILPSYSISPNFKVLIFPYNLGDTLPSTVWNASHTAVTVNLPTYSDVITFSPAASGKTDFNVVRAGQMLINMNTPIAPFQ